METEVLPPKAGSNSATAHATSLYCNLYVLQTGKKEPCLLGAGSPVREIHSPDRTAQEPGLCNVGLSYVTGTLECNLLQRNAQGRLQKPPTRHPPGGGRQEGQAREETSPTRAARPANQAQRGPGSLCRRAARYTDTQIALLNLHSDKQSNF